MLARGELCCIEPLPTMNIVYFETDKALEERFRDAVDDNSRGNYFYFKRFER